MRTLLELGLRIAVYGERDITMHIESKERREGEKEREKRRREGAAPEGVAPLKPLPPAPSEGQDLRDRAPARDVFNPFVETPAVAASSAPERTTYNISVFAQDTLWDLRQRIAQATGITPYRQHLRTTGEERGAALGYQLQVLGIPVGTASPAESTTTERLGHVPIDARLAGNAEDVRVLVAEDVALEQVLGDETALELWDLQPWLHDLPQDEYQFRTLYHGFILKYWPQLTFGAFSSLVRNPVEFAAEFPHLARAQDIAKQDERLRQANHYWEKSPHANKLVVRRAMLGMLGQVQLNLEHLFEQLSTAPELPILVLTTTRRTVRLYRAPERYTEQLYGQLEAQISQLAHGATPSLVAVLVATGLQALLLLTEGGYRVDIWRMDERQVELDRLQEEVGLLVNPLLREINGLGRTVFYGRTRLPELTDYTPVEQLEITLIWSPGQTVGTAQFNRLQELLQADAELGLITLGKERRSTVVDRLEYRYRKGVRYPPLRLENANQYEYLSSGAYAEYLAQRAGLLVEVQHRMTDIAVTCKNLPEENLRAWHAYVLQLLERLVAMTDNSKPERPTKGNLKQLKQRDPELFLPKTRDHVVYSRVCQKSHQPTAYTEEELAALAPALRSRAVRYWNFTTQQPMWYACPGNQYPHVGFIAGRHPQGFCYPCCKKTLTAEDPEHKTCLQEHVYTEPLSTTHDRYIYNYGKELAPGRLGHLPPVLGRYLQYVGIGPRGTDDAERETRRRGRPLRADAVADERRSYYLLGVGQQYGMMERFGLLEALAAGADLSTAELVARLALDRLEMRMVLDSSGAELERLATDVLQRMPRLGFRVCLLTLAAGAKGDDVYGLQTTGEPRRPAIVLFRRTTELTPFGNYYEWYPVVEVNELAFFRDRSVYRRHFAPETELARLLRTLGGESLLQRALAKGSVTGCVGEPPFAAIVRLASGRQTVLPAQPDELSEVARRPHPALAHITATREEVRQLVRDGELEAQLVYGGKAVALRLGIGCVWHAAAPVAEDVASEALPYPPEELYRAAPTAPEPVPESPTARLRAQYHQLLRALLEHLDAERNPAFRRRLAALATNADADNAHWLQSLPAADRQKIEQILGLGLPADVLAGRLALEVYQSDLRELAALTALADEPRPLRARLTKLLRRLGHRPPAAMVDIISLEFSDPVKRQQLRIGYHPTIPVPLRPWEDVLAL